jgi:hypothetical protein
MAAAAAGKPVCAKRKAADDNPVASDTNSTVVVVANKPKPSSTPQKSKSRLYGALVEVLMKKRDEKEEEGPVEMGLPIHDLLYHIWQYANGTHARTLFASLLSPLIPTTARACLSDTTETYSYIEQKGGPDLHYPNTVLVVPVASKWNGGSTGLTFLVLHSPLPVGSFPICRYSVNEEQLAFVALDQTADRFRDFTSACFDPTDPNRVFLSDNQRVYSANEHGHLTVIAGGGVNGMSDGIGSDARFCGVRELACTKDGSTLYVAEYRNKRVRAIELSTRKVRTVLAGGRGYQSMCWDTTDGVEPFSELYVSSEVAITRLVVASGKSTVYYVGIGPACMICTIGGYLVASLPGQHAIYIYDTRAFDLPTRITRSSDNQPGRRDGDVRTEAEFHDPSGIALVADEQAVVVADMRNHHIRSVPLPARLFEKRPLPEAGSVTAAAAAV